MCVKVRCRLLRCGGGRGAAAAVSSSGEKRGLAGDMHELGEQRGVSLAGDGRQCSLVARGKAGGGGEGLGVEQLRHVEGTRLFCRCRNLRSWRTCVGREAGKHQRRRLSQLASRHDVGHGWESGG